MPPNPVDSRARNLPAQQFAQERAERAAQQREAALVRAYVHPTDVDPDGNNIQDRYAANNPYVPPAAAFSPSNPDMQLSASAYLSIVPEHYAAELNGQEGYVFIENGKRTFVPEDTSAPKQYYRDGHYEVAMPEQSRSRLVEAGIQPHLVAGVSQERLGGRDGLLTRLKDGTYQFIDSETGAIQRGQRNAEGQIIYNVVDNRSVLEATGFDFDIARRHLGLSDSAVIVSTGRARLDSQGLGSGTLITTSAYGNSDLPNAGVKIFVPDDPNLQPVVRVALAEREGANLSAPQYQFLSVEEWQRLNGVTPASEGNAPLRTTLFRNYLRDFDLAQRELGLDSTTEIRHMQSSVLNHIPGLLLTTSAQDVGMDTYPEGLPVSIFIPGDGGEPMVRFAVPEREGRATEVYDPYYQYLPLSQWREVHQLNEPNSRPTLAALNQLLRTRSPQQAPVTTPPSPAEQPEPVSSPDAPASSSGSLEQLASDRNLNIDTSLATKEAGYAFGFTPVEGTAPNAAANQRRQQIFEQYDMITATNEPTVVQETSSQQEYARYLGFDSDNEPVEVLIPLQNPAEGTALLRPLPVQNSATPITFIELEP